MNSSKITPSMATPSPADRPNSPVIDFHVHMLDEHVFKASTNKTVFTGYGATPAAAPRPGALELLQRMMKPETEIEDMDARGIDVSVVTSSTVLQGTSWAEPQTDLDLCRRCNDTTAGWVAKYPKRFAGSSTLPPRWIVPRMMAPSSCSEWSGGWRRLP